MFKVEENLIDASSGNDEYLHRTNFRVRGVERFIYKHAVPQQRPTPRKLSSAADSTGARTNRVCPQIESFVWFVNRVLLGVHTSRTCWQQREPCGAERGAARLPTPILRKAIIPADPCFIRPSSIIIINSFSPIAEEKRRRISETKYSAQGGRGLSNAFSCKQDRNRLYPVHRDGNQDESRGQRREKPDDSTVRNRESVAQSNLSFQHTRERLAEKSTPLAR